MFCYEKKCVWHDSGLIPKGALGATTDLHFCKGYMKYFECLWRHSHGYDDLCVWNRWNFTVTKSVHVHQVISLDYKWIHWL
jgi:hypothetical protein